MSNRQARREQQRTNRPSRPTGSRQSRPGAAPPKRSGGGPDLLSRPFLIVVSGVVVLLAVILGVYMVASGGGSDNDLVKKLEQAKADIPADLVKGTSIGKDDAPFKLVAYEDFQCPYCLKFTAEQEGELIDKYVKTGQLQITYKHLPILGRGESTHAAIASQCAADQDKFWLYQNKLFTVQAQAGQLSGEKIDVGRFSDDNLRKYASELGLDQAKFDSCLNSGKFDQLLADQNREAKQYGFSGTPSFLVNGQPLGSGTPSNIDGWQQIFDAVSKAQTAAAASASPSATGSATTPAPTTTTAATPAASPTR